MWKLQFTHSQLHGTCGRVLGPNISWDVDRPKTDQLGCEATRIWILSNEHGSEACELQAARTLFWTENYRFWNSQNLILQTRWDLKQQVMESCLRTLGRACVCVCARGCVCVCVYSELWVAFWPTEVWKGSKPSTLHIHLHELGGELQLVSPSVHGNWACFG